MRENNAEIQTMRLQHIIDMNKLFIQSMNQDYSYFPASFKNELIRGHSVPRLIRSLISPKSTILLAYDRTVARGYCIVRLERLEPSTLLWIYTDQMSRGKGLGRNLVQAALQQAGEYGSTSMQLLTHDKDDFFAQQGFERLRRVPGMLAGVDMSIMRANL